jgi:Fibronectin type III domain
MTILTFSVSLRVFAHSDPNHSYHELSQLTSLFINHPVKAGDVLKVDIYSGHGYAAGSAYVSQNSDYKNYFTDSKLNGTNGFTPGRSEVEYTFKQDMNHFYLVSPSDGTTPVHIYHIWINDNLILDFQQAYSYDPVVIVNTIEQYDSVTIEWQNPNIPQFVEVEIYVDQNLITTLQKTKREYTITNLFPETDYTIEIYAVYQDGKKSVPTTVLIQTKKEPPPEFSNAKIQYTSGGYTITWDSPTSGQVKVYIEGKEYATVDASLKQFFIPQSDMKYNYMGDPDVSIVPISKYGTVGTKHKFIFFHLNVSFPFTANDLLKTAVSLLGVFAPILLLVMAFQIFPKLKNLIVKYIKRREIS